MTQSEQPDMHRSASAAAAATDARSDAPNAAVSIPRTGVPHDTSHGAPLPATDTPHAGAPSDTAAGLLRCALVLLALACTPLSTTLMNAQLFPLFDAVFPFARDIGEFAGVIAAATVALVALHRPALLRLHPYTIASLVLWAGGLAGTLLGLRVESAALLVASTSLAKIGGAWLSLLILVACGTTLDRRQILVGVPLALALGSALALGAAAISLPFALGVYALATPLGALAIFPLARTTVNAIATSPAGSEMALSWPSSYLPLGSRLYVCIFVFSLATGFAQRFGAQEGRLESLPLAVIACVAVTAYCLLCPSSQRFDLLFGVAVLFTIGGFLLVPVPDGVALSSGALIVGDSCYQVLHDLVLFSLARRNRLASLSALAWAWAWGTLGIIVGANAGALVQAGLQSGAVYLASAAVAIALLAYVLFGLRSFSFDATIEGVVPVEPLSVPQETPGRSIERACAELAASRGLTARETDVLCLLARGRNNSYIQEELGLTRNTVKSHIKHVYQKLDVHSQQELIDAASAEARDADR